MALLIFEHLEDFDNTELSEYERDEQLREAVRAFNEENGTSHPLDYTVRAYKRSISTLKEPEE